MKSHVPKIPIAIIEQTEEKPFNRGKLLNIGALQFPSEYYIMHDIDMLPVDFRYEPPSFDDSVIQFALSDIQKEDYLGGVTMFPHPIFIKIGGYNNDYFHRAEDNEMMFNLKRLGIPVYNDFQKFRQLPHPRTGKEFDPKLWKKAQEKRRIQDQLNSCAYDIIATSHLKNITHLIVSL
jgi:hypothetical protein